MVCLAELRSGRVRPRSTTGVVHLTRASPATARVNSPSWLTRESGHSDFMRPGLASTT